MCLNVGRRAGTPLYSLYGGDYVQYQNLYGKHIITDGGTYSIDKLIVELWFDLNQVEQSMLITSFDLLGYKECGYSWEKKEIDSATWLTHRYRFSVPKCDTGIIVEMLERKVKQVHHYFEFDEDGDRTGKTKTEVDVLGNQYGVRIQFNPNKHLASPVITRFFDWYKRMSDAFLMKGWTYPVHWRWRRVDYAFDVPLGMDEVCLLSRKEEAYQYTTRYYGKRGKNGHTRVYDKRAEYNRHPNNTPRMKEVLTRFEWEQHSEQDVTFDKPLIYGDIPKQYQWLRFIKLGELNACLKTLDKRTRKKIKDNCFREIPFDTGIFDKLLKEYQEDFGLQDDRHWIKWVDEDLLTDEERENCLSVWRMDANMVKLKMLAELNDLPDTENLEREFYNNSPIKVVGADTSLSGASVIEAKEE